MDALCDDLQAEHAALDAVLDTVTDWDAATPADGWSIRDSVSHLWFFDQRALLAMQDPEAFGADAEELLRRGIDASVEPGRAIDAEELHANWRADRARMIAHARTVDPSTRVVWYGPAMGARSFITARLMETWAHGQDIVDAVGGHRPPTERLKHVAHIGVRARPFSYAIRGIDVPEVEIHVALDAPDASTWTWGDADAADRVSGDAEEFCLVVTQRRHLDDTSLTVDGPAATEWMGIAQAFAGPPGPGRSPLG